MVGNRTFFFGAYAVLAAIMATTLIQPLPVLAQMCLYSSCAIFIGCHLSLHLLSHEDEHGNENEVDTVSQKDAMMFPVFGSIALFSLYVAYKWFGQYYVNLLLSTYLSVVGVAALGETLMPILKSVLPEKAYQKKFDKEIKLPWPLMSADTEPEKLSFTLVHIVSYVISGQLAMVFWWTKNWILHNIFGISFCVQAISIISLGKFKVGFILLAGLFVYDIFWVFGSDVMVTVAKSFDAPAKLIFPISLDPWKQSILGLGDIVVPGIFISLCLRFDAVRSFTKDKLKTVDIYANFPKIYFTNVMIFYNLGLITTGLVMFWFNHAQPALLYLCPAVSLSVILTSVFRGELDAVLGYDEEEIKGPKASEKEKEDKKAK